MPKEKVGVWNQMGETRLRPEMQVKDTPRAAHTLPTVMVTGAFSDGDCKGKERKGVARPARGAGLGYRPHVNNSSRDATVGNYHWCLLTSSGHRNPQPSSPER